MSLRKLRATVNKQRREQNPLRHAVPLAGKGLDSSFTVVGQHIRANKGAQALHQKLLGLLQLPVDVVAPDEEQDDESTGSTTGL